MRAEEDGPRVAAAVAVAGAVAMDVDQGRHVSNVTFVILQSLYSLLVFLGIREEKNTSIPKAASPCHNG